MEKSLWKTFLIASTFVYMLEIVYAQNQTRIVGNNTIVNWNFQLPAFNTKTIWAKTYANSFTGWNCSGTCQTLSFPYTCTIDSRFCIMASNNQVMDLESPKGAYNLSQSVTVSSNGYYQLNFLWLPPRTNPLNNKSVAVFINNQMITNITLNSSNIGISYWNNFVRQIIIASGINVLKFVMRGPNDGYGIILDDVQFRPVSYPQSVNPSTNSTSTNFTTDSSNNTYSINATNSTMQNNTNSTTNNTSNINNSLCSNITDEQTAIPQFFLQIMFNNSYVSSLNSIPGSRVFFSFLMHFYISFDRLQFYYFHKQNLTQYAQIFLSSVHYFQEAKGSLAQMSIRMISFKYQKQNIAQEYLDEKTKDLQLKNRYRNDYIFDKGGKGDTFISSQLSFFYYQAPSIIVIHTLLWFLFCRIFNYRISRIFRTFFMAIMEGNIEQFVFYLFTDIQRLFNSSFYHKIINVISLFFGFLCCFFAFCILIILYGLYKRLVKYLVEDYKPLFNSMICITLQSGIFPFLSGITHAYLYDRLLHLTILLVFMESIWIVLWFIFMKKNIFVYRRKAIINICNCFLRIYLLVSLYLYELYGFQIINKTHYYFVIIFLSLWILQILITLTICVIEGIHFFSTSCVKNKIRNTIYKQRETRRKETSTKVIQFTIGTRRGILNRGVCKSDRKHDKKVNKLRIQYMFK